MNNQLLNLVDTTVTGFNKAVDFLKGMGGGNTEVPLTDILVISRVLFAVVMIGFIGYFFDHTKQSLLAAKSNRKTKD